MLSVLFGGHQLQNFHRRGFTVDDDVKQGGKI